MGLPLSPHHATQAVLWGGLAIGLVLGAVAQATRFCTMGALADRFSFGGHARLMMWVLAVAVAASGSLLLIGAGALDATRALPWSERLPWLSCAVGGAIFGAGMVLASGCPQRSLVKAGAGSLKALVTLLVVAVTAQMTLRGVLGELRVKTLDVWSTQLGGPQDLGTLIGGLAGTSPSATRWAVLAVLLALTALLMWRYRGELEAGHWVGGIGVGLLVTAAWWLTGDVGFLPEHPDTLEAAWMGTASHRPEGLSFAAPMAQGLDLLTLWSDKNMALSFGVIVSVGVVLGSAASAWRRGEFQVEAFRTPGDLGSHLVGGALMGFGAVTSLGCSIGQGITGLSLLSAGACIAVTGIVVGAQAALRWQAWRIERSLL
jgi:uncharacterized membrane protein YedE/YeeE